MERHNTIEESIVQAFREINKHKSGKIKLKTIDESMELWNNWIKESTTNITKENIIGGLTWN